MKDGRVKVGGAVTSVEGSLPKKNRRLTFPFGPSAEGVFDCRDTLFEHNIREIPLSEGALGCALWDGGLVLTRWLYTHGAPLLLGKRVLDLGCGVGLGGIMAAHFANSVTLTDYIPEAIRNAQYNIGLNHMAAEDVAEGAKADRPEYDFSIRDKVDVAYLDWDAELNRAIAAGTSDVPRGWTPAPIDEQAITTAADGVPVAKFAPKSYDVMIGAELTYNLLSCESLAFVVDAYLAQDGVFIEVLSDDRDGVGRFVEAIEARGFVTHKQPAPAELVGNYGTRKWSKQADETYSLFQWRRAATPTTSPAAAAAAAAAAPADEAIA